MVEPTREELVRQIKEAGRELIDRAESLVGDGLDCITDLSISIDLTPCDRVPELSVSTRVLRMNTLKRWTKECE